MRPGNLRARGYSFALYGNPVTVTDVLRNRYPIIRVRYILVVVAAVDKKKGVWGKRRRVSYHVTVTQPSPMYTFFEKMDTLNNDRRYRTPKKETE